MSKEFLNKSGLDFADITCELYRVYEWADGTLRIDNPSYLNVSKSGGHRIYDAKGISHYIPSGWRHLYWETKEGESNFIPENSKLKWNSQK